MRRAEEEERGTEQRHDYRMKKIDGKLFALYRVPWPHALLKYFENSNIYVGEKCIAVRFVVKIFASNARTMRLHGA